MDLDLGRWVGRQEIAEVTSRGQPKAGLLGTGRWQWKLGLTILPVFSEKGLTQTVFLRCSPLSKGFRHWAADGACYRSHRVESL